MWIDNTLYYTLVNQNQLRHYGTRVQYNPMSKSHLSIITEYGEFSMELSMEGTIIFSNIHTPYDKQLQQFPHINLSLPHPWDPIKGLFPKWSILLEGGVGEVQYIIGVVASHPETENDEEFIFFISKKWIVKLCQWRWQNKCRWLLGIKSEILGLHMYQVLRLFRYQSATHMSLYMIWVSDGA